MSELVEQHSKQLEKTNNSLLDLQVEVIQALSLIGPADYTEYIEGTPVCEVWDKIVSAVTSANVETVLLKRLDDKLKESLISQ